MNTNHCSIICSYWLKLNEQTRTRLCSFGSFTLYTYRFSRATFGWFQSNLFFSVYYAAEHPLMNVRYLSNWSRCLRVWT
ncbi:hypothetical protein Hanom_Chr04g00322641 [Helianthus anomalus]